MKVKGWVGGTSTAGELPAPATYTPRHLVEKILNTRSALEGERKQVTVLFADVKGSMDLAEQVDPEEWHRIMDRFFAILSDGVHRFEGTINQYTGDGIMALFGAPIAHEDHAQRACFAALQLRDALRHYADQLRVSRGLNFSVRMGANSGEVVVGKIGDDLRMDYTAQGHAVGLAARMEQLAEPGKVLLTQHTAKLVTGFFALRDLGPSKVKGVSEPLHVFELEGAGPLRTRFDLSRARGFSRFVGRAQEMGLLEAVLARAFDGSGRVVGVVADAGTGKSRLCYEFAQRCRGRGIEVLTAAGVSHGKSVAFLPMMELLRSLCGVSERDAGNEARRKIAGTLLLRDERFKEDLPLLFDFLGIPDPERPLPRTDPDALQRQLFGVVKRLIYDRTRGGVSLLVFEDLQWVDGASLAALEQLIDVVPATRTLLLMNFRPEYHADWMRKPWYQKLPLQPLGAEAVTELLRDLLGPDPALAALAERIRERTGGTPFFIEEIVQALVEEGSLVGMQGGYRLVRSPNELVLPATVQAVLAARIDRLSEREKHVVQTASVIGKEVHEPVLRRVLDALNGGEGGTGTRPAPTDDALSVTLRALVAAQFLCEEAAYPEAMYAFKHPLTQEVAYRSQLADRRARVHAAVARIIEEIHAHNLNEQAALLAHHWEAAGEAWRAAAWHRRAAEWAGARDRNEMLRHWRHVRTLLGNVPERPETLALGLLARENILHNGLFLGFDRDEAPAVFAEGMELGARMDDPTARMRLLGEYGMVRLQAGDADDSLRHLNESLRLADASGNALLQLAVRVALIQALMETGKLRAAIVAGTEADALSGGDFDLGADILGFSPYGSIVVLRGAAQMFFGRLEDAARDFNRALEVAQRRNDAELLTWGHGWSVLLCEIAGDVAPALGHARQAIERAERMGTAVLHADACLALARAQLLNRQWSAVIDTLTNELATVRERHVTLIAEPALLSALAQAYIGAGNLTAAGETAAKALAMARRHHMPLQEIGALLATARVQRAAHGTRDAEAAATLDATMALVRATEARYFEPLIYLERAELARRAGDESARSAMRAEAQRLFVAMGASDRARRMESER